MICKDCPHWNRENFKSSSYGICCNDQSKDLADWTREDHVCGIKEDDTMMCRDCPCWQNAICTNTDVAEYNMRIDAKHHCSLDTAKVADAEPGMAMGA